MVYGGRVQGGNQEAPPCDPSTIWHLISGVIGVEGLGLYTLFQEHLLHCFEIKWITGCEYLEVVLPLVWLLTDQVFKM
jgi:hypothetical protein